jgi:hypothetical protein
MPLAMMRTRAASPHAEGLQRGLRALIQADVVPAVYAEDLNPVGAGAIGGLALDEPTARKVAEIEAEASHGLRGVRLGQRAEAEVQVNEPLLDAPLEEVPSRSVLVLVPGPLLRHGRLLALSPNTTATIGRA